eukprot:GFYU01003395.1.p1 GENE.GFYU01003395.1~~GFYU01003395.1.p1  ORF type:complete len:894 (-),score=225.73 GFYU01003395.1:190-2871(-)
MSVFKKRGSRHRDSSASSSSETFESPSIGWITLCLKDCRGIRPPVASESRNLFCEVSIDILNAATDVAEETLEPKWNQSFEFPIKDWTAPVTLTVKDRNKKVDEILGKCTLSLSSYSPDGSIHELEEEFTHYGATIRVAVTVLTQAERRRRIAAQVRRNVLGWASREYASMPPPTMSSTESALEEKRQLIARILEWRGKYSHYLSDVSSTGSGPSSTIEVDNISTPSLLSARDPTVELSEDETVQIHLNQIIDEGLTSEVLEEELNKVPLPHVRLWLANHIDDISQFGTTQRASQKYVAPNNLITPEGTPRDLSDHGAATTIARYWRGYRTRQRFFLYFHSDHRKTMFKRIHIVLEIISSEESYVKGLRTICDIYLKTIRESGVVSPEDIRHIFSDVEVIRNYHEMFLAELKAEFEEHWPTLRLSEIFLRIVPFLSVYSVWINNFDTSASTLSRVIKKKNIDLKSLEQMHNIMSLPDYLIMPVQRCPRYCLLLRDLIKRTPAEHPDMEGLTSALEEMQALALSLNEKKKEAENMQKLLAINDDLYISPDDDFHIIESYRQLIIEGEMSLRETRGEMDVEYWLPRKVYLFTDLLLLCSEVAAADVINRLASNKWIAKEKIWLKGAWIEDMKRKDDDEHKHCFTISRIGGDHSLSVTGETEKTKWLQILNETILAVQKTAKSRKSNQQRLTASKLDMLNRLAVDDVSMSNTTSASQPSSARSRGKSPMASPSGSVSDLSSALPSPGPMMFKPKSRSRASSVGSDDESRTMTSATAQATQDFQAAMLARKNRLSTATGTRSSVSHTRSSVVSQGLERLGAPPPPLARGRRKSDQDVSAPNSRGASMTDLSGTETPTRDLSSSTDLHRMFMRDSLQTQAALAAAAASRSDSDSDSEM